MRRNNTIEGGNNGLQTEVELASTVVLEHAFRDNDTSVPPRSRSRPSGFRRLIAVEDAVEGTRKIFRDHAKSQRKSRTSK